MQRPHTGEVAASPGAPAPSPAAAASNEEPGAEPETRLLPLAELAPAAMDYLAGREGQWAMAVALPGQAAVYSVNGDELFPLASVSKVVILATFLYQADREGRWLTDDEISLAHDMIVVSDNESAVLLWEAIGKAAGVSGFLEAEGLTGIEPAPPELGWGDTRATAHGLVRLLESLFGGSLLSVEGTSFATALMQAVIDEQRWGASVAFGPTESPLAVKDGWWESETGWRLASVAVDPSSGGTRMVVVLLAQEQPTFEYGVETIEGAAARVAGLLAQNPAGNDPG